jgi:hypothetical protein
VVAQRLAPATRVASEPLRFDWKFSAACFLWSGGITLDGWNHVHLDTSTETFFTPWHAILYAGYLVTACVLFWEIRTAMRAGATFREAIPAGYGPSVVGVALFAAGGLGDMLWHLAFGIERGISAAYSPTHLLLLFALTLTFFGPLRALVARGSETSLRDELPALLALTYFLNAADLFNDWNMRIDASAAESPLALFAHLQPDALAELSFFQLGYGLLALVARAVLLGGVALYVARALPRHFGTLTLIFGLNAISTTLMRSGIDPLELTLSPNICAGLIADAIVTTLRPGNGPHWRLQLLGFAVPFVYAAVTLAIVGETGGGYWWEVHAVTGCAVMAGFCGLLIASVMRPLKRVSAA